jgi:ABC-type sulfate/molybdate transport systems ATPase subunit
LVSPLIGRGCGATRVLTSHDPQAALAEADLVLGLEDGRAAFVTSPDKVDAAAVKRLYA